MVYEVHGIMSDQITHYHSLKFLGEIAVWADRKIAAFFEKRVLAAADSLIVQTDSVKHRLTERYSLNEKPIEVVPNGVDIEKFDPRFWQEKGKILRQQNGWDGKVVCLYAGYLDCVNGVDFVVDSIEKLDKETRRKLKIVFAGRGPLQELAARAAEQNPDLIEYKGLIDYDEIPAWYSAADVFMIPRPPCGPAEKLLPMKLLEAMAMEKLLLVSDVAAMADVITNEKNGVLFEKGNADDFVNNLKAIVSGRFPVKELARQAREDVLNGYTWENSRNKLQAIYDKLIDNKQG
jgi:glycosyltransferase involved in cell wall biosynthesis